jgi:choline dehydrogenase-like flavoprotein
MRAGVQVFGTMVPREDHTMTLDRLDDPVAEAMAPVKLLTCYDDQARKNMEAARDRFVAALAAGGVGARPEGPFHELQPGSSVHFAGTVRMHADPRLGVLDGWNRIHDVPNVAVVDMAAFTTNPEKNPTLTAMALAVRASRRLADELRTGATL